MHHASIIGAVLVAALTVSAPAFGQSSSSGASAPPTTDATGGNPAPSGVNGQRGPGDRPTQSKPEEPNRNEGFHIGPIASLGFPRPFSLEGFARFGGIFGAGVEYGFLPRMTVANVDMLFQSIAADFRIFPFHGAFFVGIRGGRQWLDAATSVTVGPVSVPESVSAATWYLNPQIGFLHSFESGLTLGIDAGIQLPLSPEFKRAGIGSGTSLTADIDQTTRQVANALGNSVTPTIDLLRVGFLF